MSSGDFSLKDYIEERAVEIAHYIIETKATVRQTAKKFGISKSTIHKDLRERLLEVDMNLYHKVSSILQYHMDIRHIRGGESTRRKYLEKNAS